MVLRNDVIVGHRRVQLAGDLVRWRSPFAAYEHDPTSAQPALVLDEVRNSPCP
jgi:hypothetical protein